MDRASLTVKDGKVAAPDGKPSFDFGELTKGKKLMQDRLATTRLDHARQQLDGRRHLGAQGGRPATLLPGPSVRLGREAAGDVVRQDSSPPSFKATLVSVKTAEAEAKPGVTVVHDGDFIGVTAPERTRSRTKPLKRFKANGTRRRSRRRRTLFKYLKDHLPVAAAAADAAVRRRRHAAAPSTDGLKAADAKLDATYTVAYIAHTPLEPRVAVAEWNDGKADRVDRNATALRRAQANWRAPSTSRTAESASSCPTWAPATAASTPARRRWRRHGWPRRRANRSNWSGRGEEEFTWAYFRPAGVMDVKARRQEGRHAHRLGVPQLQLRRFGASRTPYRRGQPAYASFTRRFAAPTGFVSRPGLHRQRLRPRIAHGRPGPRHRTWTRSLPSEEPQGRAPPRRAGSRRQDSSAGARTKPRARRGFGIACGTEKGSYVATCAEVTADRKRGRIQVERIVSAFDCGAVLTPII